MVRKKERLNLATGRVDLSDIPWFTKWTAVSGRYIPLPSSRSKRFSIRQEFEKKIPFLTVRSPLYKEFQIAKLGRMAPLIYLNPDSCLGPSIAKKFGWEPFKSALDLREGDGSIA